MWHITTFQPVSLTSLKLATATSTGGKSLLLPTPYALKMALLNVVIQDKGLETGVFLWQAIRDGKFAIHGPDAISVTNTFTKILKPMKDKPTLDPETGLTRGMINSIGFREYVHWHGAVRIAFEPGTAEDANWTKWLTMITYIGKRGGFIQATGEIEDAVALEERFVYLDRSTDSFLLNGTLQLMDDCASNMTFEQVDVYSGKNIRTGKERILRQVVIPYQLHAASRAYTHYQRID